MNQQFSGEFKETLKLTNTSELLEVLVEERSKGSLEIVLEEEVRDVKIDITLADYSEVKVLFRIIVHPV